MKHRTQNTEHRTRNGRSGIAERIVVSLFCVLCSVFVVSCFTTTSPGPVDRQLTLAPGQTSAVKDAGVSIKFVTVTGDNRCPGDAICITGGSADIRIEVRRGSQAEAHDLRTGDMQPVRSGDFTIALVEVTPYPFSTRPIKPEDYRVTLRVSR
jgi:hypothetical protein